MSFTQGLSGLNAASKDLEVIGNNVANVNTVGFKSSQAQFADVFAASLGGAGSSQIGIGAKLATVAQQFTQGTISTTNNPLDMAINGPGFFTVSGVNGIGYSRNGQFQADKNGFIVTSTGLNLQGWPAVNGALPKISSGPTVNLQINTTPFPPAATSTVTAQINLDSRLNAPTVTPFDPANQNSYTSSTSTTVYSVAGIAETNTLYFAKALPAVGSVAGSVTTLDAAPGFTQTIASTVGLVAGEKVNGTTIATIVNGTTFTTTAALGGGPAPVAVTFGPTTATTTAGSNTVTVGNTLGLVVGQTIPAGAGNFPAGTTITSILNGTTFTTSAPAGTTAAAGAITFGVVNNGGATPTSWNVYTTVSDPNAAPTVPATYLYPTPANTPPAPGASWTPLGTMTFNLNGVLATPANGQLTLPAAALPPVLPGPIIYNFAGTTQYGSPFAVTKLAADGNTEGNLVGYSASADGTISGTYSNGQTQALGRVALATFANNQGLQSLGNNEWAETAASGKPVTNQPGVGINGVLQTASVEGSNTDLTSELVNMITAQRDYQANSQTIKTQDAIMQTLINMR